MKIAAVIVLWAAVVVGGLGWLLEYKQSPGAPAVAPSAWPESSRITHDPERLTLVMLVHPRCPCSRASVAELGRVLTHAGERIKAHVVVVLPEGSDDSWRNSELAASAAEIKGVTVELDPGGREAKLFGAFTSGQTQLFSPEGLLLFSGGITPSRGHHGESFGASEIERLALMDHAAPSTTQATTSNVYGCDLKNPVERPEEINR